MEDRRKLGWPHFGLMGLYWLVFTRNNFILQFGNVWKVEEVQESASWHSKARPSPLGAVLMQHKSRSMWRDTREQVKGRMRNAKESSCTLTGSCCVALRSLFPSVQEHI